MFRDLYGKLRAVLTGAFFALRGEHANMGKKFAIPKFAFKHFSDIDRVDASHPPALAERDNPAQIFRIIDPFNRKIQVRERPQQQIITIN